MGAKQVCDGLVPAQSCRGGPEWIVAGLAVAEGPLWGEQLTAGQVPLSKSAWMMVGTQELGSISQMVFRVPGVTVMEQEEHFLTLLSPFHYSGLDAIDNKHIIRFLWLNK